MLDAVLLPLGRHRPLRRFWKSARGFWRGPTARLAWGLIALLIVTVLQLVVLYRLNLWNRDFFNALEFRNGAEIWHQTHLLVLFVGMSIALAVTAVWGRMTFQRSWRGWVSRHLIADDRSGEIGRNTKVMMSVVKGEFAQSNRAQANRPAALPGGWWTLARPRHRSADRVPARPPIQ